MCSGLWWTLLWAALPACPACSAAAPAAGGCPSDDWRPFEGSCFWLSAAAAAGSVVPRLCGAEAVGAGPASVSTPRANAFLAEELLEGMPAWVGLMRADGDWRWQDGSEVAFESWLEAEAAEDGECAVLNANGSLGLWAARPCEQRRRFVCQLEEKEAAEVEHWPRFLWSGE